jgi:hypothetical protein
MENLPHRPSVWFHTPINIQFCTLNRVVTYDRFVCVPRICWILHIKLVALQGP